MSHPLYQWADLSGSRKPLTVAQGGKAAIPQTSVAMPTGLINWQPSGDSGGDSSTSETARGGASTAGKIGATLGTIGALTGTPELSMAGGALGVGSAAAAGHYGPAGSMAGRAITGSPIGGIVGGLAGRMISNDSITAKTIGSAALGAAIPGFGVVDALTGGWASNTLMGKDATFDVATGGINQRTSGLFGALGAETPTGTLEAATARSALATNDPLGAFAESMSSQQDVRDQQRAQESFRASEISATNEAGGWSSPGEETGGPGTLGSRDTYGSNESPGGYSGGGDYGGGGFGGGGESEGTGHGGESGNGGW